MMSSLGDQYPLPLAWGVGVGVGGVRDIQMMIQSMKSDRLYQENVTVLSLHSSYTLCTLPTHIDATLPSYTLSHHKVTPSPPASSLGYS
jgi:hypothetical protein